MELHIRLIIIHSTCV